MPPTRHPAVAGRFYPADPQKLRAEVESYLFPTEKPPSLGCVAPHAGYIYSGHVAGAVFSTMQIPSTVLLLCPNHTGKGHPLSINSRGAWETPLGDVAIDSDLAADLQRRFPLLADETEAHRSEHAAEVELPFLQVLWPDVRFVPIAIATGQFEVLEALGSAIAEAIAAANDKVLILASSDLNHYEDDAITRIKDHKAIAKIIALDPRGLYEVVEREKITMCGVGPAVAMLIAAKQLGATSSELVKYATSGDISGDRNMVVGYAGIRVG
jgi:MEMO1 family protein